MYAQFYGFKEAPFNLTPDSHFLYLSAQHKDALGHLLYGIRERKGFILISGEVGTGKTTLCRALIRRIEDEADVGFILNTFLSAKELLKAINDDLIGKSRGRTKKELVDELNLFLLRKHAEGRNIVLLVDECQNLSDAVLEQIRMLSNLETEKCKLLQIVMVGQPEIIRKLEKRRLRQLAQRISVSYHLQPLDYEDMVNYIYHRIRVAMGDGRRSAGATVRFGRAALKRIFAFSGGVPRKVNVVCDRALLIGYTRGKRRITEGVIRDAIKEVRHPAKRARRRGAMRRRAAVMRKAAFAVVPAAIAVLLFLGYRVVARRGGEDGGQPAGVRERGAARPRKRASSGNALHEQTPPQRGETRREDEQPPGAAPAVAGKVAEPEEREPEPEPETFVAAGVRETESTGHSVPEVEEGGESVAAREGAGVAVVAEAEGSGKGEDAPPAAETGVPAMEMTPEADAALFLAGLWGIEPAGDPGPAVEERDLITLAELFGLKAVPCWADSDFIARVNLPCIVRVKTAHGGKPVPGVLISLDEDGGATVRFNDGEESIKLGDLVRKAGGRVIYYCPRGFEVSPMLTPGSRGRKVAELQENLKAGGWLKENEEGWYGPETVKAVRRFQNNYGLPRDGIVGLNERVLIQSDRARPGMPRLIAERAEGVEG